MKLFSNLAVVGTIATFGLLAAPANAKSIWDQLNETAPRTVFDDIRDAAPRTIFDDLQDSAPLSAPDKDVAGE